MSRFLLKVALAAGCAVVPIPATAQNDPAAAAQLAATPNSSVLITPAEWREMASSGQRYPLFAQERARLEREVRAAMASGVNVPQPRDLGGGSTHEQHKANYKAINGAGILYRLTSDRAYADFARDLLLAYADIYPNLPIHPAGNSSVKGKLFWQALNDSVWLVYAIQGYDAIRDSLTEADRSRIDRDVFRRMTDFLSVQNAEYFDRIHNHATWATAGVGMTGYVLRDEALVQRALNGTHGNGQAGFLRQVDLLFSPDGYYAEGPYYQRYALAPFIIFADAIQRNEPQHRIFERRDGVLLKAVEGVIQASYGGLIFPINDAIPDKGLDSEEILTGVSVAYNQSHDARLLSIARGQGRTILSPGGLAIAKGLSENFDQPFDFRSLAMRDGPRGDLGNLVIMRDGRSNGAALVMKNTQQGQGHGHLDRLNWLFYDNGQAVITDYGAARFLNIEAKDGGGYLPENDSWAQQTVAHNTLVVNGESQFGGDWRVGERHPTTPLLFAATDGLQIASARLSNAYPGVTITRTLTMISHPDLTFPVVIDLVRAQGEAAAVYDLPVHFNGQIITQGFEAEQFTATRPVLGGAAGYQHLWVDARSPAEKDVRSLTWLLGGRFYTYRFAASAATEALLVESGANDPRFNLRREQALIRRMTGQSDASFVALLEPHGAYDGRAETVSGSTSRIRDITSVRGDDAELVLVSLASGATLVLAVSDEIESSREHTIRHRGNTYQWTGAFARFDQGAGQ